MIPFNLYKHVNCTDTAIAPIMHPLFVSDKNGYEVTVVWFNVVNPDHIYELNIQETVFIKTEHMKNWEQY